MLPTEPVWCAFCQDRPMVGRMIVMVDGTNEQIGTIDVEEGGACDLCGRSWTGAKIAEHEEDDRVAVLQYDHPDFEKLTDQHIREFSAEHTCSLCGRPTEELPEWAAERILRANPRLAMVDYEFDAICMQCANNFSVENTEDDDSESM